MKKLILFLLLMTTFFNCKECKKENEQTVKKGVVEINEKFIKYKSDKLIKYFIIKSMEEDKTYSHQDLLDIDNTLPYGNYKIIYPSFYNSENEIDFKIDQEKTTINYFVDSLDYNKAFSPFIDQLQENETIRLINNVSGCFSSYGGEIKISKKGNDYYINNDNFKNKKLNTEQVRFLKEFEFEMFNLDLKGFYCTNTEKTLLLNDSTFDFISIEDSSCWYYGFSYLMEKLNE